MAGGAGGADVRIKLIVDDGDQKTTEKLKQDLGQANKEVEQGHKGAEHLGSELLKASLYTEAIKAGAELVAEGMRQAYEMAEKMADAAMEAADESNQQVRTSAGLISMMDRGAHSMGELRDYAKDVREELAEAGTQAGVSTQSMQEMFDKVIERGGRSTEEAKELTAQMAIVGKIVPQGMEGLAQGFNMMELGIVRARNPLVQLIASTGTLKGNAHDVAKEMQKMTPAEQIAKATEAIEKQAKILKAGGANGLGMPTLPEIKNSLSNIREGFLEAVGEPMLNHIIPALTELRDFLMAHKEEIEAFGAEAGNAIAKVVDFVETAIQGLYHGIQKNWHMLGEEFEKVFGDWRSAWDHAFEQTGEIKSTFESIAETITNAFAGVLKYVKAAAEVAMDLNDLEHFQMPGTSRTKVEEGAAAGKANQFGPQAQKDLDETIAKYRDLASSAHISSEAVDKYAERLRGDFERRQQWGAKVQENVENQNTDQISMAINSAGKAHDEASEAYAFNMIAKSDSMVRALMTGAIAVDGGFEELQKVIDEQSPELAKRIKALRGLTGEGVKGQGPSVTFNGATFNIKQDFRDQDPDRIMRDFRKDIGRAATTRRQARTGSAFGL